MTYVIAEPCNEVKNGACVEVCPAACIHTTPEEPQHYIDPDICIECEQCVVVCPVEAIFLDTDLPPQWRNYIEINANFFRHNKAIAQPVSTDTALRIVEAVHGYAARAGIAVTAAVVDEAGAPIAVGRMQGADPITAELAFNKAYTAAYFQVPTHQLIADSRQPWFRSLVVFSKGRVTAGGGAFPIIDEIAVIGAIGVAGGLNNEQDILCCRVGLAVLEDSHH